MAGDIPPDSTRDQSRTSIHALITQGLGYCCPWIFFSLYRRTGVIADRLGVTTRAIKLWKAKHREGKIGCESNNRCMASKFGLCPKASRPQPPGGS